MDDFWLILVGALGVLACSAGVYFWGLNRAKSGAIVIYADAVDAAMGNTSALMLIAVPLAMAIVTSVFPKHAVWAFTFGPAAIGLPLFWVFYRSAVYNPTPGKFLLGLLLRLNTVLLQVLTFVVSLVIMLLVSANNDAKRKRGEDVPASAEAVQNTAMSVLFAVTFFAIGNGSVSDRPPAYQGVLVPKSLQGAAIALWGTALFWMVALLYHGFGQHNDSIAVATRNAAAQQEAAPTASEQPKASGQQTPIYPVPRLDPNQELDAHARNFALGQWTCTVTLRGKVINDELHAWFKTGSATVRYYHLPNGEETVESGPYQIRDGVLLHEAEGLTRQYRLKSLGEGADGKRLQLSLVRSKEKEQAWQEFDPPPELNCLPFRGTLPTARASVSPAPFAAVPTRSGHVIDSAGLLSPLVVQRLEDALKLHEQKTTNQVVVLTVPTIAPEDLEQYSRRVFEEWDLGQRGPKNGLLFLVIPNDGKVNMNVVRGRGLSDRLTNVLANRIIQERMLPPMRKGDYDKGLSDGVMSAITILEGQDGKFGSTPASAEEIEDQRHLDDRTVDR